MTEIEKLTRGLAILEEHGARWASSQLGYLEVFTTREVYDHNQLIALELYGWRRSGRELEWRWS
jgi:hypothetical protein